MNVGELIFDPILPWPAIWVLAGVSLALLVLALWRGLPGWWLRGIGLAVLLAGLAQPAIQREERAGLSDIVVLIVDETASQALGGRARQVEAAVARVEAEIAALPNTELRKRVVRDGEEDAGSLVLSTLAEAIAEEPRARIAGAIVITDGQVHDLGVGADLPAPLQVLLTGEARDWDRRVKILTAPAFGIIGEPVTIRLMVEEQGNLPAREKGRDVGLSFSIDGADPQA